MGKGQISAGFVVLYLLFGLLWIHGSDALIALLVTDVALFEQISRAKGTLFVILSGALLYLLAARVPAEAGRSRHAGLPRAGWLLATLLLLILTMPLLGSLLHGWLQRLPPQIGANPALWGLLAGLTAAALAALLIAGYRRQLGQALDRQASQEASRREHLLGRFFDMPFIGMALTDIRSGQWLRVNDCLERMLGCTAAQLQAQSWRDLTHPDDLAADERAFGRLLQGELDAYQLDKRFRAADGHYVPVRIYVKLLRDSRGDPEFAICMVRDLTRERADQAAVQRQSDLYNMLSRINQVILYSHSIDDVLRSACRIAVEEGRLSFAWIGRCDDQGRILESIAHAGDDDTAAGISELLQVFARHPGRGLSERALVQGRTVVVNDSLANDEYQPWHDFSRRYHCRAAIALPLHHQGRVFANLTLYADSTDFFTPALVKALEELARDIGFALDSISRDQALEAANQVINASPFVLVRWRCAPGWPIQFVSDNISNWGLDPQRLMRDEGAFEALIHPDDRERVLAEAEDHLDQGVTRYTQVYRLGRPDQPGVRWIEDRTHVLRDARGQVVGLEGVLTDISERQQQESRLRQADAVIQHTREAVLITDARQRILRTNPAFSDMFGWREQEICGRTTTLLRSSHHPPSFYQSLWQQVGAEGHWQGEIMCRRSNGEVFPALLSVSRIRAEQTDISHYVAVFTDLTRLRDSESRIEYLALHDALTGLPNRKALLRQLEACARYNRHHERVSALLMADLDNFRDINDSFGHSAGDQLLLQVVERLRLRLADSDQLYRLGGDEFAILLEEVADGNEAAIRAEQLMQQLGPVFRLGDEVDVHASASFGISLIDRTGQSPELTLQQADAALFKAKEQRGSISFFSDGLTAAVRERLKLEQRLRRALEQDELCLYYQPQWSIDGSRMTGVEALIRWLDPEHGMVPPSAFIPVAEQSALIGQIGSWVLNRACEQIADWQRRGIEVARVAVNVSPQQLRYHQLPEEVAATLARTGIDPGRLELELTESALMSPGMEAVSMLNALRRLGVRLAIDDFGTGYSSLAYLKRFPLDLLKIDKSFTDDLLASSEARAIVETIIVLGHKLGLQVLAEGVEQEAQRAELAGLGCHQFQGYLYSRPLPVAELEPLLGQS